MKTILYFFLLVPFFIFSQQMSNDKLDDIYTSISDSIQGENGRWQFYIKDVPLISLTDVNNNRMRVISPVADSNSLNDDLIKACLVANFHTALDVKYAVSDGVLWSVFIHPLKELSESQVKDAVLQVFNANINFGTTFSSSELTFPGRISEEEEPKELKKQNFRKL